MNVQASTGVNRFPGVFADAGPAVGTWLTGTFRRQSGTLDPVLR